MPNKEIQKADTIHRIRIWGRAFHALSQIVRKQFSHNYEKSSQENAHAFSQLLESVEAPCTSFFQKLLKSVGL
jgi:hypothetical protein